jgi:hypothetical protein
MSDQMQYRWAAVKARRIEEPGEDGIESYDVYDVWQWNLYKMKWVRLANTACGFSELRNAQACAKGLSDEIDQMLQANKNPPPSLK